MATKRARVARLGAALCAASSLVVSGCSVDRGGPPALPVFDSDVARILDSRCVRCHEGPSPAAGWDATTYLGAIACAEPSGAPVTSPRTARAPILAVLGTPSHRGLLSSTERATVEAWVIAGAPAFAGTVHTADIIDPRAPGFHGALLRGSRWRPMLDAADPGACGRCHDGTLSRPAGVTLPAPGATACTTCHDQPGGVLACGTCHGSGARSYPPRDPCFFPEDASSTGAHAAHVEPSLARTAGFGCATCHPAPGADVLSGLHGDGIVEVRFDLAVVGPGASFDRATGQCSVTCHDAGGLRPRPLWSETTPMGCNDCHRAPPPGHFSGSCKGCHAEANATGTKLFGGPLHLDGRVELGNGNGQCGACHGKGASPWPSTAAHPSHEHPTLTEPVACASCHVVPSTLLSPGHLDGVVTVRFTGRATGRGAQPTWSGASCSDVACHGANLVDTPAIVPVWTDGSGAAAKCGACHGVPPSQHTPSTDCSRSDCHGGEVGRASNGSPFITTSGLALHIDGLLESNR